MVQNAGVAPVIWEVAPVVRREPEPRFYRFSKAQFRRAWIAARHKRKLRKRHLTAAAQCSERTIDNWMDEEIAGTPDVEQTYRLAAVLGVTFEELLEPAPDEPEEDAEE